MRWVSGQCAGLNTKLHRGHAATLFWLRFIANGIESCSCMEGFEIFGLCLEVDTRVHIWLRLLKNRFDMVLTVTVLILVWFPLPFSID